MKASQNIKRETSQKRTKHASLLAKCTAPFHSKQRNPLEQDIRLDEPFRQYSSGDAVKGAVHMNVAKSQRITHLVIRLHGFVKVSNRAKLPGESISYDEALMALEKGRGRRGIEYFGNGFARLFEKEIVLCGEGRVLGQYEFRFEILLPSKGMPSGIDFEHGTISYLLTSTVTRPTTIAPTFSQHRKLGFLEAVDISLIPKPKAEMVSMDVGYKRGKSKAGKKKKKKARSREREDSDPASSVSGKHNEHSDSHQIDYEPPRSPVPSEFSSAATTDSRSSNMTGSVTPPIHTVIESAEDTILNPSPTTLSAKIEVLQGGCLAGDSFPVRISIKHNTAVKSMQGIIITLYRQGRIDTHPAIPLGPQRRGEKPKYEDYYPKSFTGLGGLSLTSAGSSRSFRQDLNQIFAPIIVDPQSLTAVISTSIQAPVHLFPTITCVPGEMVSFKYYVEIVVDLRAKIGGQDRIRPHLSMTSGLQHGYGDAKMTRIEGSDGVSYAATPGFNYLVTDQLRRTKGVVFTRTEIIVGTKDSSRKRRKQREDQSAVDEDRSLKGSAVLGVESTQDQDVDPGRPESYVEVRDSPCQLAIALEQHPTVIIPPIKNEEDLDEKGRLRRAEERLLPSAPPQNDEPASSAAPIPSAPMAIDEEDFIRRYGPDHPAPAYDEPQDDKMELERQRLLARASAPDTGDGAEAAAVGHEGRIPQPSAPVLYEDDMFDINDPRVPQVLADQPHSREPSALVPNEINPQLSNDMHDSGPSSAHDLENENLPVYIR
ncbi:hypothetical protein HO173_005963 [Letharia columbiana]|uniref:Arrestin-like N-terminal domain-containing protein n=1 Tax=Letharia columbiana TaxID=112416 RepID=A0A8H6FVV5_9LECA|nr:uncharacterized protein HO173_005963 [Letharia columbiana]KAF6235768.1 hypothetical protein HO173_005963 [Letharia columbiana]